MKKSTITELIALLFIILFLYAGISKMMEFKVFKEQISESAILAPIAKFIAWCLPICEFIVAILLFIPNYRKTGFYSALGLMALFTCYIIAISTLNRQLPCSCGGIFEAFSWTEHLIFNFICILLAIVSILLEKRIRSQ